MRAIRFRPFVSFVGILALALVAGCASSEVVPATQHPVSQPESVQIYQNPPRKYEILGQILDEVPQGELWDAYGNANAVFDRLKAKAAKLGANGLLLTVDRSQYVALAGAGYNGTQYNIPMRDNPRTAVVLAIYVIEAK
jgi:hypothetical protein